MIDGHRGALSAWWLQAGPGAETLVFFGGFYTDIEKALPALQRLRAAGYD